MLKKKELEAIRHIRNSIMDRGRAPSTRELMASLGYRSPRSAAVIIDRLIDKGFLHRRSNGNLQLIKNIKEDPTRAQTIDVPLVGTIACGTPILAEENIEGVIPVSVKLARPPHRYFLLKANGDSMNEKGINDGDLVLVRQTLTAENGEIVVALVDDEATIKELYFSKKTIVLKPRSSNNKHKPILLTKDFLIQGVVVTSIGNF